MQFARDAVRSPRASNSSLAFFKRSTTQGFKFGLFKSAKRSGASTTSPLLLGLRAITGCALSVVMGPGPAGGGRKPAPPFIQGRSTEEKSGTGPCATWPAAKPSDAAAQAQKRPARRSSDHKRDMFFSF